MRHILNRALKIKSELSSKCCENCSRKVYFRHLYTDVRSNIQMIYHFQYVSKFGQFDRSGKPVPTEFPFI